jgi:hypothetical protein
MTNEEKIKIAKECGLIYNGVEDDAPQFIGTDEQFEEYEEELGIAEEEAIIAGRSDDQDYGEAVGSR